MERGIVPTPGRGIELFANELSANEITMLNPQRCGFGRMIKPDEYSPPRLPPALIARMPTVRRRPRENGGTAADRCRRDEITTVGVHHG
jgi:hypothetical protein